MEILSQEEMAARLDFRRPLKDEELAVTEGVWCIPFEWGANAKGTRITIAKAKEIAAELRAEVARAEYRELRKFFDREKERAEEFGRRLSEMNLKLLDAQNEAAILRQQMRALKKRTQKSVRVRGR
jgi:hypothetical protein